MTFLLGIICVAVMFFFQMKSDQQLINQHSMILVLGGTFCVTLLVSPWQSMKDLIRLAVLMLKSEQMITTKREAEDFLKNPDKEMADPYELYAQARDLWEMNVTTEEFESTLTQQAESVLNRHLAAIAVLRNLGKYPPALGMVGTVMGMIQLFAGLSGSAQQSQIGTQLALAMTATFYGLLLSNFIVLPLADRLETREEERRMNLERTVKLLLAVQKNQPNSVTQRVIHVA